MRRGSILTKMAWSLTSAVPTYCLRLRSTMRVISPSRDPAWERRVMTNSTRSPSRAFSELRWLTYTSFSNSSERIYIAPVEIICTMPSWRGRSLPLRRYFSCPHSSIVPWASSSAIISRVRRRPSLVAPPEAEARCLRENLLFGNSRNRLIISEERSNAADFFVFFSLFIG